MLRPTAASDQAGAAGEAALDAFHDPAVLQGRDYRPHLDAILITRPDHDPLRRRLQARQQGVMDRPLDQQARGRRADLPLVPEDAELDPFDRFIQVAIGEHDERGFPAQLQADGTDVAGRRLHHLRASGLGTGEGELVDTGMRTQRRTGLQTKARHQVEDPGR